MIPSQLYSLQHCPNAAMVALKMFLNSPSSEVCQHHSFVPPLQKKNANRKWARKKASTEWFPLGKKDLGEGIITYGRAFSYAMTWILNRAPQICHNSESFSGRKMKLWSLGYWLQMTIGCFNSDHMQTVPLGNFVLCRESPCRTFSLFRHQLFCFHTELGPID